jgi:putative peptidoglycan lipid II flippase
MGILNSSGRFGVPALAPTLFNAGMILTPILLYSYFDAPIYTLAIGVLLGGLGQILFQVPSLKKIGYHFHYRADFKDEGIRRINRLISPMILGLSASRINILVSTLLASMLMEGAMSYLNYAYRLMHFPLGVFGVALGTVALPKVSEQVASKREDLLVHTFHEAVCLSSFLVIPSAIYLAGFGTDLVRLIYERGAFGIEATAQTSRALLFYSFGLVGFAGVRVTAPVFYAMGDAKRPMIYSLISVGLNIVLNFALIPVWGFAGLAAATSVAGLVNYLQLIFSLRKQIPSIDFRYISFHFMKVLLGGITAFLLVRFIPMADWFAVTGVSGKILVVFTQIALMGILYFAVLNILGVGEVGRFLAFLNRFIRK